jgi:SAM-dependent methyltransferase
MRNWFEAGGGSYARFRPDYPGGLADFLASTAPARDVAVYVGCGTGQLTTQLAPHFASVIGLDPSAEQIANAVPHARVRYAQASAEDLPLAAQGASLITVAQAAHWFDLPKFYAEVRRIGAARAVIALISYGVLTLEDPLDERFRRFYHEEIGGFWPPERRLVDSGYATLEFPFEELAAPELAIRKEWALADFLGYVSTWSAFRQARERGRGEIAERFAEDLAALWGEPARTRRVVWPLKLRLGRL